MKINYTENAIEGLARAGNKEAIEWFAAKKLAEMKLGLWIKTPEDEQIVIEEMAILQASGVMSERESFLAVAENIENIMARVVVKPDDSVHGPWNAAEQRFEDGCTHFTQEH